MPAIPMGSAMTVTGRLPGGLRERKNRQSTPELRLLDAENFCHLLVEESLAWSIGLDPFAINHELGNRSFPGSPDYLFRGPGSCFNINFLESNVVLGEETLGGTAIGAPESRIDRYLHV